LHCKTFFDNDDPEIFDNKCPACGYELNASTNMPADIERDTMKIEIESRGEWIRKMNEILGYDNSDGIHSEPTPHDLAKELRKFVQDVEESNLPENWALKVLAKNLLKKLRTPPVKL